MFSDQYRPLFWEANKVNTQIIEENDEMSITGVLRFHSEDTKDVDVLP